VRAAFHTERGPIADVVTVGELPTPEPGENEVRVKIAYAGVNPTDWKFCEGAMPMSVPTQVFMQDGSGTIDAVGPGVSQSRIGERVWVYLAAHNRAWATSAEYSVVPSTQAVALPDHIGFTQAAGLAIPYLTAHACLYGSGSLDGNINGKTIVVAGGAGAVGHAAIELAVLGGATVITTVSSPEKAELARAAGAHHVVNYREANAADQIRAVAPNGVDRIVEVALTTNLPLDLAVIKNHGVIVTYASEPVGDPTIPVRALMTSNVTLQFVLLYNFTADQLNSAIAAITDALHGGHLTPMPELVFPLEQTAQALEAVKAGAPAKVLVALD
jgi:NADPH:quinone reductase